MLTISKAVSFGFLSTILFPAHLLAGPEAAVPQEVPTPTNEGSLPNWVPSFQIGYLHQFDTDMDNSGSFSVNRANVRAGVSRVFDRNRITGLSFGYGYDGYDFSDTAADPWSDIHSLSLALPVRWALADSWDLFLIPTIRSSGESGSSFTDSLSGGGLAGVSYRFGDRLTLGPGFGVLSQIEDDVSVFPILLMKN